MKRLRNFGCQEVKGQRHRKTDEIGQTCEHFKKLMNQFCCKLAQMVNVAKASNL